MKTRIDPYLLAALVAATTIAATQGYVLTLAEPDLARMVMGLVYGGATGQHLAAGFHYGSEFSFGYYELLYRLVPEAVLHDPDAVAQWFNRAAVAFAGLFALGLALMLNRLVGSTVAVFVTTAFLLSPSVLPLLASGHPAVAASALLFLGCWLVSRCSFERLTGAGLAHLGLAFVALLVGLSFRAEIALAFPFVVLAPLATARQRGTWPLRASVASCAVAAAALACFLWLQRPYVANDTGGALHTFLATFASLGRVARGLGLLVLALGLLTALLLPVFARLRRQELRRQWPALVLVAVLVLPSLAFWLPNPQPVRHLLVPVLGLYLLFGLLVEATVRDGKRALLAGLVLAIGNQLVAELVRPVLVKNYQWQYAAASARRSTQQLPLGLFPLDQMANRTAQAGLRAEAIDLVARRPRELVVMADAQSYMAARLIADDPSLRLARKTIDGVEVLSLSNKERSIYFVDKSAYWPQDILPTVLASGSLSRFPIYLQKSTMSRYDKAAVPALRRYGPVPEMVAGGITQRQVSPSPDWHEAPTAPGHKD